MPSDLGLFCLPIANLIWVNKVNKFNCNVMKKLIMHLEPHKYFHSACFDVQENSVNFFIKLNDKTRSGELADASAYTENCGRRRREFRTTVYNPARTHTYVCIPISVEMLSFEYFFGGVCVRLLIRRPFVCHKRKYM